MFIKKWKWHLLSYKVPRQWLTSLISSFFQSIMSYNGGAVMAMRGKNCVAIAADRRFGIQAQLVTTDFQKIFPMGERLYIGLAGLATDVQTVWVFQPLSLCYTDGHHGIVKNSAINATMLLCLWTVHNLSVWTEKKHGWWRDNYDMSCVQIPEA